MRAFLAIELDHQLRAYAAGAVSDVRRHVDALAPDAVCSWVRPEQLHLTVRFLGELSDTAVGAVARVLQTPIPVRPFDLALRGGLLLTADTLAGYGTDEYGGRVHDLLGTRCDPYVNKLLTGQDFHFHCHSNLVRAVMPFGLTEFDVHDVLNVFQVTGLNHDDLYFMRDCPAKAGDYLEFFAEIDLLCALSTCPGGDLSVPLWGPEARDPIDVCRPLSVEVYRLAPELTQGWQSPSVAPYRGQQIGRAHV